MSAQLRKRKSETVFENLRHGRQFRSDQGVVWDEIENKYARMAAERSPTMAMADLYESHKDFSSEYVKAFQPVETPRQANTLRILAGHSEKRESFV
jgi:hypothetical protein